MMRYWYYFEWYACNRWIFKSWCANHAISVSYVDKLCERILNDNDKMETLTNDMKRIVRNYQ